MNSTFSVVTYIIVFSIYVNFTGYNSSTNLSQCVKCVHRFIFLLLHFFTTSHFSHQIFYYNRIVFRFVIYSSLLSNFPRNNSRSVTKKTNVSSDPENIKVKQIYIKVFKDIICISYM